eukprot:5271919-Prorocentrum_lima.AAC.1
MGGLAPNGAILVDSGTSIWEQRGIGENSDVEIGLKSEHPLVDAMHPNGWVTNINGVSTTTP